MFIPYATNHPVRRFPVVTVTLIGINVLVYLIGAFTGSQESMIASGGYLPGHPSLLRAVSSDFIHGGLMHLLGNMWYLWVFGIVVEDGLGPGLYLAFYFLTAFAATGLHHWFAVAFSPESMNIPAVGASGAIAGILGVCAVRYYRTQVKIWYLYIIFKIYHGVFSIPSWVALSLWIAPEFLGGIRAAAGGQGDGVAHWAHIGGFVLGVWLSLFFNFEKQGKHDAIMDNVSEKMQSGSALGAEAELREVLAHNPRNTEAHLRLARALMAQSKVNEALESYREAMRLHLIADENDAGIGIYKEISTQTLPDMDLYMVGVAMEKEKRYLDAMEIMTRLASEAAEPDIREQAAMRRGKILLFGFNRAGEAKTALNDFLQKYPDSIWRSLVESWLAGAEQKP